MYDALVSVDLGRQNDWTAVLVVEEAVWIGEPPADTWGAGLQQAVYWPADGRRGWVPPTSLPPSSRRYFRGRTYGLARPDRPPLLVRHIERTRHRSYVQVADEIAALLARPPLGDCATALLVDAGGVGRAVIDFLWQMGLAPRSLTATAGDAVHVAAEDDIRVPKRELIAAAQLALHQGRLRIAAGLPEAATLTRELADYRVTISQAGHDSYSAREGAHDDLVYALAQAVWFRDWFSQHVDDDLAAAARIAAAG